MADWDGRARSNYFRVKDEENFRRWAESIGTLEVFEDGTGRVGLLSHDEFGRWPLSKYDEETGDEEEIDLFQEVAAHLQKGSVAVFMEVGAVKLCYLNGHALAVNCKGETVEIALSDIYELAKTLGDEVTFAED